MTKKLTEQWYDGTLPLGTYYIVNKNGYEEIDKSVAVGELRNNADLKEVLAPVPSYDEWKKLDDELKELATMNDTFAIENGRLRERLVIAKKALVDILNDGDDYWDKDKAQEALAKMEGVK